MKLRNVATMGKTLKCEIAQYVFSQEVDVGSGEINAVDLLKYCFGYLVKLLHCFTANEFATSVNVELCSHHKNRL